MVGGQRRSKQNFYIDGGFCAGGALRSEDRGSPVKTGQDHKISRIDWMGPSEPEFRSLHFIQSIRAIL
jgi:hypothetical protein